MCQMILIGVLVLLAEIAGVGILTLIMKLICSLKKN